MLDFPKKYNQIKNNHQLENKQKNNIFYLADRQKEKFDIQEIFRIFLLDAFCVYSF